MWYHEKREKYYYHVTDKENLKSILENGLEPRIGKQSSLVGEQEPFVFLCKRKDVGKWKIILNKQVVLQIRNLKIPDDNFNHFYICDEFFVQSNIPVSDIKRVYTNFNYTKDEMKNICLSYIDIISAMTVFIAKVLEYPPKIWEYRC